MTYRLFPLASEDVETITFTIANDNPLAATRWLASLYKTLENLGSMPMMGVARHDVRPGLRTFVFGKYLILHRAHDQRVDIVRVVHGAREWELLV